MASIKGLSVKKVVHFKGHDGEDLIQCDVYYKGKNVGYFSMGDWGREDIVHVDKSVQALFDDYVSIVDNGDNDLIGFDYAVYDLFTLTEQEKEFKKNVKKGYEGVVRVIEGGWKYYDLTLTKEMNNMTQEALREHVKAIFKRNSIRANLDTLIIKPYNDISMFTIK